MPQRRYFVYILTNAHHTVLYTGVTNGLHRRITEHRSGRGSVFCRRYNVSRLVYVEPFTDVREAIAREKQIKGGSRQRKLDLIEMHNPTWRNLSADLAFSNVLAAVSNSRRARNSYSRPPQAPVV